MTYIWLWRGNIMHIWKHTTETMLIFEKKTWNTFMSKTYSIYLFSYRRQTVCVLIMKYLLTLLAAYRKGLKTFIYLCLIFRAKFFMSYMSKKYFITFLCVFCGSEAIFYRPDLSSFVISFVPLKAETLKVKYISFVYSSHKTNGHYFFWQIQFLINQINL